MEFLHRPLRYLKKTSESSNNPRPATQRSPPLRQTSPDKELPPTPNHPVELPAQYQKFLEDRLEIYRRQHGKEMPPADVQQIQDRMLEQWQAERREERQRDEEAMNAQAMSALFNGTRIAFDPPPTNNRPPHPPQYLTGPQLREMRFEQAVPPRRALVHQGRGGYPRPINDDQRGRANGR